MKQFFMNAKDNTKINVCLWDDVTNPKGVVQISHGMAEYCARYDDFAKFLNSKGYIVIGDDHRGHGQTCGAEHKGVTKGDSFNDTVEDIAMVTLYAKEQYKLPIILLGHSYGSFLSQAYIQRHGELIKGVILSGSAYIGSIMTRFGATIAKVQTAFYGESKPAKVIEKLSFGAYDKPFASENENFAWLSRNKENNAKYRADEFCGFTMCLGFQKSFLTNANKIYSKSVLAQIPRDLPIFIASGDKDPVGNNGVLVKKLYGAYKNTGIKNVKIKLYKDDRHEILNEVNREEVYADFLSFIDENIVK